MALNKLGTIKNIMIDKVSGEVVLATMAYAGVLGVSQKYNVLPWTALTYNTDLGGYQLDVAREKLDAGPAATEEELLQKTQDRGWVYSVYDYYASAYDAFLVSHSMLDKAKKLFEEIPAFEMSETFPPPNNGTPTLG